MERFRIVPAFDNVNVKVYVYEDDPMNGEHVFLAEPSFTANAITGELASPPQVLLHLEPWQKIEVPHEQLTDWFLATNEVGVGGFTVEVLKQEIPKEELETYCSYPPVSWYNHRKQSAAQELSQFERCGSCGARDFIGWVADRNYENCSLCENDFQRMDCSTCGFPIMRHGDLPTTCADCTPARV